MFLTHKYAETLTARISLEGFLCCLYIHQTHFQCDKEMEPITIFTYMGRRGLGSDIMVARVPPPFLHLFPTSLCDILTCTYIHTYHKILELVDESVNYPHAHAQQGLKLVFVPHSFLSCFHIHLQHLLVCVINLLISTSQILACNSGISRSVLQTWNAKNLV